MGWLVNRAAEVMAKFTITSPDGQKFTVNAPEGATQEQVFAFAKAQFKPDLKKQNPGEYDPSSPEWEKKYGPTSGMSATDKFLAGAGKAVVDIGRGVGQMVGAVSRDDVAESRRLDAPLMNTPSGTAGNIAGNVSVLASTARMPGANTIAGGAAIGALTGLLQPSTSTGETFTNLGLGGAAGAVVPAALKTWQAARSVAEPLSDAGQSAIIGRALNRAAGQDASAVAARLQQAGSPFVGPSQGVQRTVMGEIVPGSIPTVGQAAQNSGVAALERAAVATNPEITNAVSEVMQAQNAARVSVLERLAGRDGGRAFAAANRDATAEQLYGAARRLGVDTTQLTPDVLQNIASFSKRVPDEVINKAKLLAKISGEEMTDATSVTGMHWMKKAVDSLIESSDRSGDATLKRAYVGLQKDLLSGLDELSPAYGVARKTFADMSRPVNQMDIAEAIADKSINKLSGNLQPNAYANALTDKTAQRATGFSGATLENVLEPRQLNQLNEVLLDVQRSTAAQNAGRGVGSDTVQKLAYTNMLDQAGVPTFMREFSPAQVAGNLLGRGADVVYGRANREIANRLAEVMLDPAQAAELMRRATPAQRNALAKLGRQIPQGLLISAPATANAQKQ
jgi:hypothetical protein